MRALFLVRDLDSSGGPLAPSSWQVRAEGSTGWYRLISPSGGLLLCFKGAEREGRGLFAAFGAPGLLAAVEASSALALRASEARARRLEPSVLRFLRFWPFLKCSGVREGLPFSREPVRVAQEGASMPLTALPWYLGPSGEPQALLSHHTRVDALHLPCLPLEVAGRSLRELFESDA